VADTDVVVFFLLLEIDAGWCSSIAFSRFNFNFQLAHSVLGTDQNVTAHVTKWDIDADGVRRSYKGRNRNQKDLELFDSTVVESLEELHANGEDAVPLDAATLQFAKNENDFLFVDFYARYRPEFLDFLDLPGLFPLTRFSRSHNAVGAVIVEIWHPHGKNWQN
jgi:hypothetical protein